MAGDLGGGPAGDCRRADPRFAAHTAAALAERVVGLPERPERAGGGWWRVGRVVDGIAGAELAVRFHPASGRVRVARPGAMRERPFPTPPPPGGRWFDGARLRWVEPGDDDGG